MFVLINDSSEEIYEKNKHLLCTDPKETIKAGEVMKEAVKHLEYHATSIDDYKLFGIDIFNMQYFYKKKDRGYIDVRKVKICHLYKV